MNIQAMQGDELLSINGVDVKVKSSFEASSMLQGPSETFVNIVVKHGNCGPVQSVRVQRKSIAKSPVYYRLEQVKNSPSYVGYVRLKEFNALARKDLVTAMRRLQDMGASYFVLDLRDNPGGLVQAGIEIAKLFLDKGETADAFAKKLGYATPLRAGLLKLQEENLSAMNTDPWYSAYHYSHPPLVERLAAIDETDKKTD